DRDFAELCTFVKAARFDWMGVFAYSDESTNQAAHFSGKVPAQVIEHRRRELMRLQRNISRSQRRRFVGQRLPILVEGPSDESDLLWQGRLEGQAPEIDGKVLINDAAGASTLCAGDFSTVEITAAQDYDLIGRLTPPLP
ncbi:MAG: TRAM domain-containing protein, partial [Terriglobales bacterium]